MATRKKPAPGAKKLTQPVSETGARPAARVSRGRTHPGGASFPAAPTRSGLPRGYAKTLGEIKQRIREDRLRVVLAANAAMVLLYWDIGRMILDRQERAGWGAKVIDRLAADLRDAFPDMQGFSPRNLKYMRAFAAAWPHRDFVQRVVAQLPWRQNIALLERLDDEKTRLWYAQQALQLGWSQPILCLQIEGRAHDRHGKALTNFKATLPPTDSDMAAQVFKDPYLFDFLGTADPRREQQANAAESDAASYLRRTFGRHVTANLIELGYGR